MKYKNPLILWGVICLIVFLIWLIPTQSESQATHNILKKVSITRAVCQRQIGYQDLSLPDSWAYDNIAVVINPTGIVLFVFEDTQVLPELNIGNGIIDNNEELWLIPESARAPEVYISRCNDKFFIRWVNDDHST